MSKVWKKSLINVPLGRVYKEPSRKLVENNFQKQCHAKNCDYKGEKINNLITHP